MKIENNVRKKHLMLKDLEMGDCFVAPKKTGSAEVFIMYFHSEALKQVFCVSLCDGRKKTFDYTTECTKVECHLVVDDLVEYK